MLRDILDQETSMAQVTVGKWGKNLAVRLPAQLAKAAGLSEGERVDVEERNGDIVIRRAAAFARADAEAAAEEILREGSRYSLSDDEISQMVNEGRRG
jgi:antitoxin component of MazEF toxin-antitoxin module